MSYRSKLWYELMYTTIYHLCNRLDNLWYWGTQTSLDLFGDVVNTEISCAGPYCVCWAVFWAMHNSNQHASYCPTVFSLSLSLSLTRARVCKGRGVIAIPITVVPTFCRAWYGPKLFATIVDKVRHRLQAKKVLPLPPMEFCRHIISKRPVQAASKKGCLHGGRTKHSLGRQNIPYLFLPPRTKLPARTLTSYAIFVTLDKILFRQNQLFSREESIKLQIKLKLAAGN